MLVLRFLYVMQVVVVYTTGVDMGTYLHLGGILGVFRYCVKVINLKSYRDDKELQDVEVKLAGLYRELILASIEYQSILDDVKYRASELSLRVSELGDEVLSEAVSLGVRGDLLISAIDRVVNTVESELVSNQNLCGRFTS